MQPLSRHYLAQQFVHTQPVPNSEDDMESVRSLEAIPSPEHADTYEPDENLVIARLAALYPAIAMLDMTQIKAVLPTSWNDEDRAKSLSISSDGLRVIHRNADNPAKLAQNATANASAVRANTFIPPVCGVYYFEIVIKESPTGCLGIGVCQRNVQTNRLPGWDTCSYGYHGDDGHFFSSSGNGQPYGEKFGTGDTIGCGINMIENKIFFTKNGVHQGAKDQVDFGMELFPVVGMQSPHEKIDVNFGQVPFVYDIHEEIERAKSHVRKQIEAIELNLIEKKDWCSRIVSSYMQTEGYNASFEMFQPFCKHTTAEQTDTIVKRKKIMDLIKSHRPGEAIELINQHFPQMNGGISSKRKRAMMALRIFHFIDGVCKFIVNENTPKTTKMTNGTSHSSLTNGNSQQPSTSAAFTQQNPHKRSRSNHSNENDAPSRKVQSARLSVASRLSSSADHPCSSKNGTSGITNGNGVAFHEGRGEQEGTNGDISHSDSQSSMDYPPEDRAKLEDLVALGCRIADDARNGSLWTNDYILDLVEEALPCLYMSKEAIRNHPQLHKTHVAKVANDINETIMEALHADEHHKRICESFTLPAMMKMWRERKLKMMEIDVGAAVFTHEPEILFGTSSDEEEDDDSDSSSSDLSSDEEETESDDSMSSYSSTSSEEEDPSESEGLTDEEEEEEKSSSEEGMDSDQPTHSRAAIAAAH